VNSPTDF